MAARPSGSVDTPYTVSVTNESARNLELLVSIDFVEVFSQRGTQGTSNLAEDPVFTVRGPLLRAGESIDIVGYRQSTEPLEQFHAPPQPPSRWYRGDGGGLLGHGETQILISAYAEP